jgi:hypothetical protein
MGSSMSAVGAHALADDANSGSVTGLRVEGQAGPGEEPADGLRPVPDAGKAGMRLARAGAGSSRTLVTLLASPRLLKRLPSFTLTSPS